MNQNGFTILDQNRKSESNLIRSHTATKRALYGADVRHRTRIPAQEKTAVWDVSGAVWRREPYNLTLESKTYYYYRERALGHSTEKTGRLILKINALPADKKAIFSTEEIRLMRTTVNQLRNERLAKGQYTDAADDMLLKLF